MFRKNGLENSKRKAVSRKNKSYYNALDIGKTYDTVNYNASYPFLKMLPLALK
jgi:hypothetical protein